MRYPATRLAFEFKDDRPTVEAQTQLVAGLRAGYTPMARRVASSKVGVAISIQMLVRHAVVTQSQRPKHSDMQCIAVSLTRRILDVQLTSQVHVGNLVPGLVTPPKCISSRNPGQICRLRNQAYDELKSSDAEVVGAYEKLLSANLVDLPLDKKRAELVFEGLRSQLERHIIQLYQKLLLYQMKSVCRYHRNLAAAFFRDVARLDDWASQLDDIKVAEGAVRNDSEQYDSQQMRDRLQVVTATAELQYRELQGITSAIQDQTRRQEATQHNQEDKECLNDLFQTDPRHDKTRTQDTRGGLLRDSYS
ncbi:hypothetical protein ColLi_00688 [Colletotrichum liriopes]|uniref:NWD NACHT-NTPase N-terminal domain-containing protein n=1 Tax=Colletotrichum liriopes TaxID=708192 RepID=A0AA37GBZ1_9PEZI|nr:hypothetical protein ColLi_00688 [Colletotrichum liriopes]